MVEIQYTGDSMYPMLASGAVLRCVTDRAPALGDIAVFIANGVPVAHRVVGWTREGDRPRILTAGDNCGRLDPPWDPSACAGVVEMVSSGERRLRCSDLAVRAAFRLVALSGRVALPWSTGTPTGSRAPWGRRLVCHLLHRVLLCVAWRAGE